MGEVLQFPEGGSNSWSILEKEMRQFLIHDDVIEKMRLFFEFIYRPTEFIVNFPDLPLRADADIGDIRETLGLSVTTAFEETRKVINKALWFERLHRELDVAELHSRA